MAKGSNAKAGKGTTVAPCSCPSPYQDRIYGRGLRVFNNGIKDRSCTVCGTKKGV